MSGGRSTRWCFTINNWKESDWDKLMDLQHSGAVRYLTVSKEIGASGTKHLQGYLELKKKMRLGGIKTLVGDRAHLEVARGTAEQNLTYVMKDHGKDGFDNFTWGTPVKERARQDLMRIRKKAAKGESISSILQRKPELFSTIVRYRRGLETAAADLQPGRDFKSRVLWSYGS